MFFCKSFVRLNQIRRCGLINLFRSYSDVKSANNENKKFSSKLDFAKDLQQELADVFFVHRYMDLKHKVCLVSGGTSGIGLAVAKYLIKNRVSSIIIAGRNEQTGEKAKKILKALCDSHQQVVYMQTDVTDTKQLKDLFDFTAKKYGRLDVLLNSAAMFNESKWKQMIDTNLRAVINSTKLGIELMKDLNKPGVIVNLSAVYAIEPLPQLPIFSATKAGVLAATLGFSKMKNDNVRFLTACMGPTDTPMLLNFAQDDIADWAKDEQENLLDVLKIKQNVGKAAKYVGLMMQFAKNGSTCIVANGCLYRKKDETALQFKKFRKAVF